MDIKTFNLQYNKKLNKVNTYLDDKLTILYRCCILYSNTLREINIQTFRKELHMHLQFKNKKRLLPLAISIIVFILVGVSFAYYRNKQPLKVNTLDYFIKGTTIEASGLPWGSEPSETIKYFGKMDESYERYLSYMQRQIPIRQIYFKELDLSTDSIGVFYTVDGKLNNVIYVFRFDTVEESVNAHQQLVRYFLDRLPSEIQYGEVDNKVLVKNQNGELVSNPKYWWKDVDGNSIEIVNYSYSQDSPSLSLTLYSSIYY